MVVNITLLMGISNMRWQQLQTDRLTNNPSCQIALGIENITILIGILIDYCLILVNELINRKINVCRLRDRKSTRLNSSHANISYAVFCLKKKKKNKPTPSLTL